MSARRALSTEQRRALKLLADNPVGCTEAIVLAHGFTSGLIGRAARHPGPRAVADACAWRVKLE
jgi:hypothetical protein